MKRLLRRLISIKWFKPIDNRKRTVLLDVEGVEPYIYLNRMLDMKRINKALRKIK